MKYTVVDHVALEMWTFQNEAKALEAARQKFPNSFTRKLDDGGFVVVPFGNSDAEELAQIYPRPELGA